MLANWRREDYGYAAAALAAGVFLLYLVFGNFGIVASPFSARTLAEEQLTIPSVADVPVEVESSTAPIERVPAAPPRTNPPATTPADVSAPEVTIITPSGTSTSVTSPTIVEGTAVDKGAGIDKVDVTFVMGEERNVVRAELSCEEKDRLSCSWQATAPGVVGSYEATARAYDRAGNKADSEPISITVVNPGGPVTGVVSTLTRAPSALNKAATGLLGAVVGLLH